MPVPIWCSIAVWPAACRITPARSSRSRSPDLAGSLGGGGRYDNLVGMFLGEQVPACGISLGLERILVVMGERDMFPASVVSTPADVMVVNGLPTAPIADLCVRQRSCATPGCAWSSIRNAGGDGKRVGTSSSSMRRRAAFHSSRSSVPKNWQTAR